MRILIILILLILTNAIYNTTHYYYNINTKLLFKPYTPSNSCISLTNQITLLNHPHTYTFLNKKPISRINEVLIDKSWVYIHTNIKSDVPSLNNIDMIFTHPTAYYASHTRNVLSSLYTDGHQYINAIDHMYDVTGNKYTQRRILTQYIREYGCNIDSLCIMPTTYLLSDIGQCQAFFTQSKNSNISWIVKPYSGEGGNGISVHHGIDKLTTDIKCHTNYLAQHYIKPLLLDSRKFDIRAYFLIALTHPYIVFYHPGYLRLAMRQYKMNEDRAVHLTNTHVQSKQDNYVPTKHMWTFNEFQQYLIIYNISTPDYVARVVEVFIKRISLLLFNAGKQLLTRKIGSYQLVGVDCLIDYDLKPWFTEANNYPLFINSPVDIRDISANVAKGMLELVFLLNENPPDDILIPGYKYHDWELIYSEQFENCYDNNNNNNNKKPYDPCLEFS